MLNLDRLRARSGGYAGGLFAGTGYSAVAQAAPLVVNVALTPVLIRRLGLDRFGLWSLVLVLLFTLTSLDGGVSASLARFYAFRGAHADRAGAGRLLVGSLALFLALGALVTGGCLLLAPAVGLLHISPQLHGEAVAVLRFLGPLLTLALVSDSAASLLQAHGRFRALAGATLGSCAVYAAGVLMLVHGGAGSLTVLAAVTALRFVVLAVTGLLLGARHLAIRRPLLPERAERREFTGYAVRMQLSGLTVFLNGEIDAFVIAALLPVRYVGMYAAGYQVAAALRSLPLYAFPPVLTRLTEVFARSGLPGAVREYQWRQARWLPAVLTYGAVTTVAAPFAVRAWLGPGLALSGAVAAVLLAGYSIHVALTGMRTCLVRAVGRPGLETRYSWLATVVNTVLTVPFALAFGMLGVVAATAVGLVAGSAYFVLLCRRFTGPRERRVSARWSLVAALAATVTLAGELPVVLTGWHGTLPLLLAGLPVLAGLAVAAGAMARMLPREAAARPTVGAGRS
ncbi:O-antigen/teichoic acid export membrane protein [Kitasatospora sp. MAP12-15]|uniref:lipopolysaccharide biosynthesis protein n=1 Tax=unclassified Kitasatospora TaxID=2633591 RepID=UPI00247533DF|nr:polysaccharide biosynthesis C-terminal domain-containing protein [Kitasatospora sp. MAP12-44]MDH6108518.1 O-antigen/teichoic acid export membrane protein [Kitasatospora sp. MAP12-44]